MGHDSKLKYEHIRQTNKQTNEAFQTKANWENEVCLGTFPVFGVICARDFFLTEIYTVSIHSPASISLRLRKKLKYMR
jgi:hypothetical protein